MKLYDINTFILYVKHISGLFTLLNKTFHLLFKIKSITLILQFYLNKEK